MNPLGLINTDFTVMDSLTLAILIFSWLVVGWLIENPPRSRRSVSWLMKAYRRDWMQEFLTREPRIFDIALIESLRQSTAFFSSASMIAIGGGVAMIGNSTTLQGLTADLMLGQPADLIRVKIAVAVGFLGNALLKFVWSHRLFSYNGIVMAAVPNDHTAPNAKLRAAQAAQINIQSARSFNRGLRSIYTALGVLGWLMGPWGLVLGTVLTQGLLVRREFFSVSRAALLAKDLSDAALR